MRPASVGFQCPECVAQGAKDTRAGRTAYGGTRSADPSLTSKVLIGINVVVWLLIRVTGGSSSRLVDLLALRPSASYRGVVYPQLHAVAQGDYWQLVTSMFAHVAVLHILFNMFVLYALGPVLEAAVGRARFLLLYFVSGLAGSAAVMWFSLSYSLTLGASGAIFGLLGALLVVAFKVGGDVRSILIWVGINFALTFFIPRISWQGHTGGFVTGVILGVIIAYAPRKNRSAWQFAGIGAVALVVAVAAATRTAILA